MTGEMLYLSSLDSARFEPVRECRIERLLTFDTGKVAAVARLSPGVIGQDLNVTSDIDMVVLSPRHEEVIGWGELYRTRDDAERHAFG